LNHSTTITPLNCRKSLTKTTYLLQITDKSKLSAASQIDTSLKITYDNNPKAQAIDSDYIATAEFDINLNETKSELTLFLQAVSLNLPEDKMNKVVLDSNRGKCIKQEATLCVCSV
jgi:hypothetical protein